MNSTFVSAFREAAPYIHYLYGKTIVLSVSSRVLASPVFAALAQDISLLNSLGVRMVLIHGVRYFLEGAAHYVRQHRLTDEAMMRQVKAVCGMVRADVEAALGTGFLHAPAHTAKLSVAGGNFLSAKPLGVVDGVDMQYTGQVRKIDTDAIVRCLNAGQLVLITPMGHSLAGVTYNLALPETASEIAIALKAEKLVFLTDEEGLLDSSGHLFRYGTAAQAAQLLQYHQHASVERVMDAALYALSNGVARVQLVNGVVDGSLLCELFTRRGIGTSLAADALTCIRPAMASDIPNLMQLIEPLAQNGTLLPRSRGDLEADLHAFWVAEHDHLIYGCAALKRFEDPTSAEVSCLVVSPLARGQGYGDRLLSHIEQSAKNQGIKKLFALTTRTADWFSERGFYCAAPEDLPVERHHQYIDNRRESKVFVKIL